MNIVADTLQLLWTMHSTTLRENNTDSCLCTAIIIGNDDENIFEAFVKISFSLIVLCWWQLWNTAIKSIGLCSPPSLEPSFNNNGQVLGKHKNNTECIENTRARVEGLCEVRIVNSGPVIAKIIVFLQSSIIINDLTSFWLT